jgi:hypothetical protein
MKKQSEIGKDNGVLESLLSGALLGLFCWLAIMLVKEMLK